MITVISTTCDRNQDPPVIIVIIAGEAMGGVPITMSLEAYDLLRDELGLPVNPCNE